MLVHRFLEEAANRFPDRIALIEPSQRFTYDDLNRRANRVGHLLRASGVHAGDRVVIALDNGVELVAAYFGALKAGAVAVPLQGGPRSDRLLAALADCAPRAAIVDDATTRSAAHRQALTQLPAVFVSASGAEREPLFPEFHRSLESQNDGLVPVRRIDLDLAAIIYTSGSTGEPRGVMLTHRNFVANARSIVSYLGLTQTDRVMCVLPFHYVYGLSLLHTHIAVGGTIVIEPRAAFPNVVLESMQEHSVTGFAGVPSTFTLLLHRSNLDQIELPSLRYVTQAGGAMAPARILEWLERGPKADFYVMYGATEAAARLTYLPPSDLTRKLGSIGRPIPNVEIAVVTADGRRAEPMEVGELVARGANVACGYWNDHEETAARFGPMGYRTGDLGYVDEEGYLFLVGRQHDMLKVGAHRVGVKEIEDVVQLHPAVSDAAVVGVAHELLGEAPVAFVVLRSPLEHANNTIRKFCADRLAPHKVPVRIQDMEELPRLAGGKVDRSALRAVAAKMQVALA